MRRVTQAFKYVNWSIHYEGLVFTILRIAAKLPALIGLQLSSSAWFQSIAERQYDRRFGVSTAGTVPSAELDIPEDQRGQAVEYTPTTGAKFGCLLSQLELNYPNFVFVDFGCGKGRTLLMASDFPFRAIVGVELSPTLCASAEENIARYRCRHQQCFEVHAQLGNATVFEFPDEPLVLYFFNPFSATILAQVLNNLTTSLLASPREALIIYYNPLHEHLLADSQHFRRLNWNGWVEPKWALYQANLVEEPEISDVYNQTEHDALVIGS